MIVRAPQQALAVLIAALGLAACQKTTTEQGPAGGTTTTTTTVGMTPAASAGLARAGEAAASGVVSLGEGAARVAGRIGEAASQAATKVEEKAPSVLQSASAGLARAGDAIGDGAITAKVKTALLADPDVKALRIDVDTRDAAVTLSGTLDQRANADKAVSIARGVDGVKSVENRLTVKSGG